MAYVQVAQSQISRRREDGSVKVFTFTLERDGGTLSSQDLPIVGDVILKQGSSNDDIGKAIKPVQVRMSLEADTDLVKALTNIGYREYVLKISEASEGLLFQGYLKEDFHEFSVYKQVQAVDLVFTGQIKALENEEAQDFITTFYNFFKGVDTFSDFDRGIDFYTRLRDTRQALSQPTPGAWRFSPDVLLGDRQGSFYEAVETLCEQLNWQIVQLGDRVAVADAYERIANPGAVQKWTDDGAGNFSSSNVNLQVALDSSAIVRYPKGRGRGRFGRVVYQWVQYNRAQRAIDNFVNTTVAFGAENVTSLKGLLMPGDTFRLETGTGYLRRNVGASAPAESGEASVFELKITNLLNGNEYWLDAKPTNSPSGVQNAGTWVGARATIKTDYSFGVNGSEATYTLYPGAYDIAQGLPEAGGYWRLELKQIYEATGITSPTNHESDLEIFGQQTDAETPLLYKKFDVKTDSGKTKVTDIYLDSEDDYVQGQEFEVLIGTSWESLQTVSDDSGDGDLGLIGARRSLKLIGGDVNSYSIRAREGSGVGMVSVVDLTVGNSVQRCLPVSIERYLLSGYVDAEVRQVGNITGATESESFDAEKELESEGVASKTESRRGSGSSAGSSGTEDSVTWAGVSGKPFIGIGDRLEVDANGDLRVIDEPEFDKVFYSAGDAGWETFAEIKEAGVPSFFFIRPRSGNIAIVEVAGQAHDILTANGESTLTLMREGSAGAEFIDYYNNGYTGSSQEYGIQVQSRGGGLLRRFQFQFFDGDTRTTPFIMNTPDVATAVFRNGYQLRVEGAGGVYVQGVQVIEAGSGGLENYGYFVQDGEAYFNGYVAFQGSRIDNFGASRLVGNVSIGANSATTIPLDVFDLARMQQRLSLGDFNNPPEPAFGGARLGNNALQLWGGVDILTAIQFQLSAQTPSWTIYQGGAIPLLILKNQNSPYAVADIKGQGVDPADSTLNSEATLALFRGTSDELNSEFMDLFNNGYYNEGSALDPSLEMGIRIQKRGTGAYRPFVMQWASSLQDVTTGWRSFLDETTFFHDLRVSGDNNMYVEGGLFVNEFTVNTTRVLFDHAMSQGGGKIGEIIQATQGSEIVRFQDKEGNAIVPVVTNDICHIQLYTGNSSGAIVKNIWRRVFDVVGNDVYFSTGGIDWSTLADVGLIEIGDDVVQKGNTVDVTRQSFVDMKMSNLAIPQQKVWSGVNDRTDSPSNAGGEIIRVWGLDGFPGATGDRGIAGRVDGELAFELSETRGFIGGFTFNSQRLSTTNLIIEGGADPFINMNNGDLLLSPDNGLRIQAGLSGKLASVDPRTINWRGSQDTQTWGAIQVWNQGSTIAPTMEFSDMARVLFQPGLTFKVEIGATAIYSMDFEQFSVIEANFNMGTNSRFVYQDIPSSRSSVNQWEMYGNFVTNPAGDYYSLRLRATD